MNVPYPVEKIVHVPKPYPVEKIVEKLVHVPKPYPVIKHIHVPVPVEKKVPYPVKVEVEKKVPYPVKVYVPKPYPVEKKVPDMEAPPKRNSYRTNFEKHRMPGAQSYQSIHQGHFSSPSSSGQQSQFSSHGGQASSSQQFDQSSSFMPQMTAMDYGFAQQSQQQQQQQSYQPYQFEQSQDMQDMQQYSNMMAAAQQQQPTGSESEQQDYVYNTSEQAQQPNMGPSGVSDSVDAASSDSVVNVAVDENSSAAFQISVPETTSAAAAAVQEPQYGESKTVSHLLQITPFTSDPKTLAYTRPVDQFVVFHTGTGFTMPK